MRRCKPLAALVGALMALGGAAAAAPTACKGAADEVRLDIRVVGVRAAKGNVNITVYPDDPARFLAPGGKLARVRVPAAEPATATCLPVAAPGGYAIVVYHDEDGDRKFGRSLVGIPTEGYGFSNDAPATVGPPSFASVRFTARSGDNPIVITLRY